MKWIVSIIFTFMVLVSCSTSIKMDSVDYSDEEFASFIEDYLIKEIEERGLTGLSVSIVMDDAIIFCDGVGYRDNDKELEVTKDTLFQIGSISKVFTGTAIMQLVERGVIALDDPISIYLPELILKDSRENDITIRMLLTHLSGLQGFILDDCLLEEPNAEIMRTIPAKLAEIEGSLLPPNTISAYGNTGYTLLGLIIEDVTGEDYSTYIRENIFDVLRMDNSLTYPGEKSFDNYSLAYDGKREWEPMSIRDIPAANFMTSAYDMALFMNELLLSYREDSNLLQQDTYRSMLQQQNEHIQLDRGHSIGLTWWLANPTTIPSLVASHGGDIAPFNALVVTIPEEQIGVYIANNTGGPNQNQMAATELGIELTEMVYQWKTQTFLPEKSVYPEVSLSTEELTKHAGYYATGIGFMEINQKGRNLVTSLNGQKLYLVPREDGKFTLKYRLLGIIPLNISSLNSLKIDFFEDNGKQYIDIIMSDVWHMIGSKITAYEEPEGFRRLVGEYSLDSSDYVNNYVSDVSLSYDNKKDIYLFSYTTAFGKVFLAVEPLTTNTAKIAGIGRSMGEPLTFRNTDDGIELFWSGMTLKQVK